MLLSFDQFLSEQKNSNGLIVYHGSPNMFDIFDINKTSHFNLYGRGFYFTDSLQIAKSYIGGILNRKTKDSHVKKCRLLVSDIYNFDEQISESELLEYRQLFLSNYDDFWFKRIYDILPDNYNLKMSKTLCTRKKLLTIKNNFINKEGYSEGQNSLTRLDVFSILSDDCNAISSKKCMTDHLKALYDCFTLEREGNGLSDSSLSNTIHRIYVVFSNEKIQILSNI